MNLLCKVFWVSVGQIFFPKGVGSTSRKLSPSRLNVISWTERVLCLNLTKCQRFDPKPEHAVFVPGWDVDVVHRDKRRGAEIQWRPGTSAKDIKGRLAPAKGPTGAWQNICMWRPGIKVFCITAKKPWARGKSAFWRPCLHFKSKCLRKPKNQHFGDPVGVSIFTFHSHFSESDSRGDLETTKGQIESVSQTFVPSIINAPLLFCLWSFQSIFYHWLFFYPLTSQVFSPPVFCLLFHVLFALWCLLHLCVLQLFPLSCLFGFILLICLILYVWIYLSVIALLPYLFFFPPFSGFLPSLPMSVWTGLSSGPTPY